MLEWEIQGMVLNRYAANVVLFLTVNIEAWNIDKMTYRRGMCPNIWKLSLRDPLRVGKYLIQKAWVAREMEIAYGLPKSIPEVCGFVCVRSVRFARMVKVSTRCLIWKGSRRIRKIRPGKYARQDSIILILAENRIYKMTISGG